MSSVVENPTKIDPYFEGEIPVGTVLTMAFYYDAFYYDSVAVKLYDSNQEEVWYLTGFNDAKSELFITSIGVWDVVRWGPQK